MKILKKAIILLLLHILLYQCGKAEIPENIKSLTVDQMSTLPDIKASLDDRVNEEELKTKKTNELIILRNSIFAQYGYQFKTKWLKNYFVSRKWYKPGNFKSNKVTLLDKENINMIRGYEKTIKFSNVFGDTGLELPFFIKCNYKFECSEYPRIEIGRGYIHGDPGDHFNDRIGLGGQWDIKDGKLKVIISEKTSFGGSPVDAADICKKNHGQFSSEIINKRIVVFDKMKCTVLKNK